MIKEARKKKQRQENIRKIMEIALLVIAAVCLICAAVYYIKRNRAEEVYEELSANVVIEAEVGETEENHTVYEDLPQVDFETLWETNTDIRAWIYIPGTQVNYPVLRNETATEPYDTYYLQHTVDGQSGLPGSIYIEPCNARDFSDYNTVIYGHHMKNRTMFATLDAYLEEGFMEEYPYVYLVTPEKSMVYEVFAAVEYDDRHIMSSFDFTQEEGRQAFLDSLAANGGENDILRTDMEVTAVDTILSLSTCVKEQGEERLLVEAVLIDEMEN